MDHHIQKVIAVMPSWATHPVAGICTLIGLETKEDVVWLFTVMGLLFYAIYWVLKCWAKLMKNIRGDFSDE